MIRAFKRSATRSLTPNAGVQASMLFQLLRDKATCAGRYRSKEKCPTDIDKPSNIHILVYISECSLATLTMRSCTHSPMVLAPQQSPKTFKLLSTRTPGLARGCLKGPSSTNSRPLLEPNFCPYGEFPPKKKATITVAPSNAETKAKIDDIRDGPVSVLERPVIFTLSDPRSISGVKHLMQCLSPWLISSRSDDPQR